MASFDDFRDRVMDLAQAGVGKAKELTEITKLNLANTGEEDAIRRAYNELGKLYYAERGMAPEGAYVSLCEKITAGKTKIEENKAKIADIKADDGKCEDTGCSCGCCDVTTDVPAEEPKDDVQL